MGKTYMKEKIRPVYITKEDGNRWYVVYSSDGRTLCYCDMSHKADFIARVLNEHEDARKILNVESVERLIGGKPEKEKK